MLYRESYYLTNDENRSQNNSDLVELIITKQRNGPIGTIELLFDSGRTKFRNLE